LYFQFKSLYTVARIYPVKSSLTFESEISVADILPVDTEVVTIRELRAIMQDPIFVEKLGHVGLRPEQALMTYSTLNVTSTGQVQRVDFIDGLLRLRRQDLGLDTAGAKSLMRRLLFQAAQLTKDAAQCNVCFSNAVSKLCGVNIIERNEKDEDIASLGDEESEALERMQAMEQENEMLRNEVSQIRRKLAEKRAVLGVAPDWRPRREPAEGEDDDDESEEILSITSASPGWD